MKEEKDIEQLFRSSFEEFEVTPPPAVRDAIARRLASPWYGRFWLLSGIAIVIATGGVLLFSNSGTTSRSHNSNPLAVESSPAPAQGTSGSHSATRSGDSSDQNGASEPVYAGETDQANPIKESDRTKEAGSNRKSEPTSRTHAASYPTKDKGESAAGSVTKKGGRRTKGGSRHKGTVLPAGNISTGAAYSKTETNAASGIPGSGPTQLGSGSNADSKGGEQKKQEETLLAQSGIKEAAKNDSIAKAELAKQETARLDSIQQANDSSLKPETTTANPASQPTGNPTDHRWRGSLYATRTGISVIDKSKNGNRSYGGGYNQASAEIQRFFGPAGVWGIGTGFSYQGNESEEFQLAKLEQDIYFVGMDSIPIYVGDTIVDYEYVENYDTTTYSTFVHELVVTTTFGLPVIGTKRFLFGKFGLEVQAGFVINFNKVRDTGIQSEHSINKIGVTPLTRLQVTYQWDHFGISLGSNASVDLRSPVVFADFRRRVYHYGFQVGLHYRF